MHPALRTGYTVHSTLLLLGILKRTDSHLPVLQDCRTRVTDNP